MKRIVEMNVTTKSKNNKETSVPLEVAVEVSEYSYSSSETIIYLDGKCICWKKTQDFYKFIHELMKILEEEKDC